MRDYAMQLKGILAELNQLSAAEEFFATLDVPYDPHVLAIARLHILRRMGDYLRSTPLGSESEFEQRILCRAQLQRAYDDFVASTPLEQRVFKVLKEAASTRPQGFVALEDLAPPPPGSP
jgi:nitrogenase-stabilizing/protective protein